MNKKSLLVITVLLIIQVFFLPGMLITASGTFDWKITEISRIGTGGDAYSLLVQDDYCYVTCGYSGFKIFDDAFHIICPVCVSNRPVSNRTMVTFLAEGPPIKGPIITVPPRALV